MMIKNQSLIFTLLCLFTAIAEQLQLFPGFYRMGTATILVWSSYYFYKVNIKKHSNLYIKGLNILTILVAVYGIAHVFSHEVVYKRNGVIVPNYAYIVQYLASILPVYSFYYFRTKNTINEDNIKKFFVLIFIVYAVIFFSNLFTGTLVVDEFDSKTNNFGYLFVSLIPFVYLIKQNSKLKLLILILVFVFITISAKRGAIFVGGISALIYIYNQYKLKFSVKNVIVTAMIVTIIGFVINSSV